MSDMTVMDGAGEVDAAPGAEAAPAVTPLREIKYVQNIGRFKKGMSLAGATFGPCTLVFGENGWGKSTLADLLRSLTTNNPDIVIGRKTLAGGPEQQVVMPSCPKIQTNSKTHAPGRYRVHLSFIMESATIKGLATRLCFWTRRRRSSRGSVGGVTFRVAKHGLKGPTEGDTAVKEKTTSSRSSSRVAWKSLEN